MPESRVRRPKKPAYNQPPPAQRSANLRKRPPSPAWFGGTILGLFVVGIAWLVVYYATSGGVLFQKSFGGWNIIVGFSFIVVGFGLLTQWY